MNRQKGFSITAKLPSQLSSAQGQGEWSRLVITANLRNFLNSASRQVYEFASPTDKNIFSSGDWWGNLLWSFVRNIRGSVGFQGLSRSSIKQSGLNFCWFCFQLHSHKMSLPLSSKLSIFKEGCGRHHTSMLWNLITVRTATLWDYTGTHGYISQCHLSCLTWTRWWLNLLVETMGATHRKPFNAWMSRVAVPALKILVIPQV